MIADNERLHESDQKTTELCDTLSVLLGEVAAVVRCPGETKSRHGFSDLPSRVKTVVSERDHLKAANAGLQTGFKAYEATVQELKGEIEALRPNAARYMWIRQQNIHLEGHDFLSFGEVLDNRIDDALAMERHP